MKLTVLGYWGGYPAAGEATSGYLLQSDGFNLLIDCGSGVLSQLQNYIKPEELDAVILSHYHADHVADIGVLQYSRLIQSFLQKGIKTLPIYGHTKDEGGFQSLTHGTHTTGIPFNPEEELRIGPFTITFQLTKHAVTCYAMRVTDGNETLVYTADTALIPELVPFSRNADLLIAECNFYKGMDGSGPGHMTSEDCGMLAQQSEARQLLLTHLPHFGQLSQLVTEAKEVYNNKVELASSGWTWGA
ncbi:MBL fold metallo-hydrolase [Fictibacillus sp. b24]|uniref:MBL fold metallo-hydrolase n=1 Tax=Fictibacillus sp. b24 TaxID=3055863 RepID=UPI0025A14FB9|nr:MBL fold metallo-hydrolase [Fictibacillus sp. b24]MDM5317729.1 MBL fold metallo-hydrolase [Fictibacillus sp. b24]